LPAGGNNCNRFGSVPSPSRRPTADLLTQPRLHVPAALPGDAGVEGHLVAVRRAGMDVQLARDAGVVDAKGVVHVSSMKPSTEPTETNAGGRPDRSVAPKRPAAISGSTWSVGSFMCCALR
jgi:hypothetical protein